MLAKVRSWLTGSTRAFDGAAGGRRWRGQQKMHAPVSATNAARGTLAARSRYMVSNNPIAAAAVTAWQAQAIGAGIKPSSQHADPDTREAIGTRFAAWTDEADIERRTDWYGLQHALCRSMIVTGEGLAIMINTDKGLRIRVLDPEQLDSSKSANLQSGGYIFQGVEFSSAGERVAYHILSQPPGLQMALQRESRRVPAEDVIHLFRQDWPGQVRGTPWMAPALLRLADLDGWVDAMLMKLKTASLHAGFVVNTDGSGAPYEGEQHGSTLTGGMEPGAIRFLDPGQDIRFSDAASVGNEAIQFSAVCERHIAASMGLPAHAFGDVTAANYSSLKSANTAWRARVESLQWSVLVYQMCLPVWRRFITTEVLAGRIETTIDAAMPVKHICPTFPSLEPVKDATAAIMKLRAGLATRREIIEGEGHEIEDIDRDLAEEAERADRLGLVFPALTSANDNGRTDVEDAA
ncbi:MAG: phage portal protein [Salinarimonas sp.]